MTIPWEIDVAVAGNAWTVSNLDPATPGPAAPLTLRHALPDDQLWPAQPLPMTTTFGLIAADVAELADVVQGCDVHLTFTAPPNPTPVTFDGTASDVEIEPARFRPAPDAPAVDGVRVQLTAIGYLAQLMEEPIVLTETDIADAGRVMLDERLFDLFDVSPWQELKPPPGWGTDWSLLSNWFVQTYDHMLKALDVDGEALGPHLDRLLRLWLWDDDGSGELFRFVVEPILDPVTRNLVEAPARTWQAVIQTNRVTMPAVGDIGETPDGWGIVVPDGTIRASRVDRAIKFAQRKRTNVSKVIVPYYVVGSMDKLHSTSVDNGNKPTVSTTIESDLTLDSAGDVDPVAKEIGRFYLPVADADAWGVDTVVWAMDRDEPGSIPPALGELVVIGPVAESVNPNGRGWVTGMVRAWTLTLPEPKVELELATVRGVPADIDDTPRLTWADLPAGVTWADLHPDHTWNDADLLKGP